MINTVQLSPNAQVPMTWAGRQTNSDPDLALDDSLRIPRVSTPVVMPPRCERSNIVSAHMLV